MVAAAAGSVGPLPRARQPERLGCCLPWALWSGGAGQFVRRAATGKETGVEYNQRRRSEYFDDLTARDRNAHRRR